MKSKKMAKPKQPRHHSNLHDCQSSLTGMTESSLGKFDTVIANTQLSTQTVSTTDFNLQGSFHFPHNWAEQLRDHYIRTEQTQHIPRIMSDAAIVQKSLIVRDLTDTSNLAVHGVLDAFGNMFCHGTIHVFGALKIHGTVEVDQVQAKTALPPSTLPLSSLPGLPLPTIPLSTTTTASATPSALPFRCKDLDAQDVKAKESVQTKHLFAKTSDIQRAHSEDLEAQNAILTNVTCEDAKVFNLDCDQLHTNILLGTSLQVDRIQATANVTTPQLEAGHIKSQHMDVDTSVTQTHKTKSHQADSVTVTKTLTVHGETKLDKTSCDDCEVTGDWSVSNRMDAKVGQPIHFRQPVQFHQPVCLNQYEYVSLKVMTNTPKSHAINMTRSILVIDSDMSTVLSVSIRLPQDPLPGQLVVITSNPSISTVQMQSSVPILNPVTNFGVGGFAQYLYIDEARKWFRVA